MTRKQSHTLKTYREAQGLSQAEAARRFRVSQAAWSRWELGTARPNRQIAKRLIAGTGVSLDVLMGMAS